MFLTTSTLSLSLSLSVFHGHCLCEAPLQVGLNSYKAHFVPKSKVISNSALPSCKSYFDFVLGMKTGQEKLVFVIFALKIFLELRVKFLRVKFMLPTHIAIKKVMKRISPSTVLFLELNEKLKAYKIYSTFLCIFTIC